MKLNLLIIYGSVRSGRQGIKAARFVASQCRARGHEVELIDPLDFPLPLLDKPSAIVCYSAGAFGGVRAAIALRAMLAELGMSSIPSIFPIRKVQDAFIEDGSPLDEIYTARIPRFLDELEWYARALKVARAQDQTGERSECAAQQLLGMPG